MEKRQQNLFKLIRTVITAELAVFLYMPYGYKYRVVFGVNAPATVLSVVICIDYLYFRV